MPLSYITVLTGCCTLIGTSTTLLVDDMASVAGQARFGIFEMPPVGLPMAVAGGLSRFLAGSRFLTATERDGNEGKPSPVVHLRIAGSHACDPLTFNATQPLHHPK